MKNFQVRLPDRLHAEATRVAESREVSIADVIREGMEVHLAAIALVRAGGRIIHERPNGERVEVVIPGVLHG